MKHNFQPKTEREFYKLVKKLIKERGNNADLNDIDTSLITDMSLLFFNSQFNGDISKWDVSNVTIMSWMFEYSQFTGDISNWDVSNVTNMEYMFANSELEKLGNLPSWYIDNNKLKTK